MSYVAKGKPRFAIPPEIGYNTAFYLRPTLCTDAGERGWKYGGCGEAKLLRGYIDVCERDICLFMDFGVYSEIGVWPIASEQKTSGGLSVLRDMALNVPLFV